jgi:transketolase
MIALTRQVVPLLSSIPVATRREGTLRGGYVAKQETAPLQRILLSAGSELQHALAAAETLGAGTRVVSLPCFARFDRESAAYREEVLPSSCRRRISIEASTTASWAKYVGLDGISLGIDRFGMSGPGSEVMKELGMTASHVLEAVRKLEA